MVLSYLQENEAAEPELVARTEQVLDKGYGMLAGYESPQKGYEWFGGDPGHEALTAYGLMEFADMSRVFDVDPSMVERTRTWLRGRRAGCSSAGSRRTCESSTPRSMGNARATAHPRSTASLWP